MASAEIKNKDELILKIKIKLKDISGDCSGMPVYPEGISFYVSDFPKKNGKITVSCLFISDEGNVCADLYRSGPAGCIDFICGITINSFEEKVLEKIISALDNNWGHVANLPASSGEGKRNRASVFKIPFLPKGA